MIVWIAHVKVGRCQTHYDETPVHAMGVFVWSIEIQKVFQTAVAIMFF